MRGLRLALTGAALSAGLLGLLVWLAGAEGGRIAALVGAVPFGTLAGLAAVEAVALIAGAQKWRLSIAWFHPDAGRPPLWRSVEATALGGVFAQLLPAQAAIVAARALLQRRHAGAGAAAWATLHEQLFDLLALGVAAVAAAVLAIAGGTAALAVGTAAALAGMAGAGLGFRLGARWTARLSAGLGEARGGRVCGRLAGALAEAGRLPWRIAAALLALGLLRVGCMAGRAVIGVAVVAPGVPWQAVVLAFPAVQLATVLPVVPGGLGTVEWVWTGALTAAGLSPAAAAEAAVALRLVLLAGFGLLAVGLLALALLRGARHRAGRD